jgi:hypothetical protein
MAPPASDAPGLVERLVLQPWWRLHCAMPAKLDGNTVHKVRPSVLLYTCARAAACSALCRQPS